MKNFLHSQWDRINTKHTNKLKILGPKPKLNQ